MNINTMSAWTVEDKRKLLVALHQHGASNLELIQEHLPNKTISEIELICEEYTQLALRKWHSKRDDRKDPAIKNWLQVMKRIKISQKNSLHDVVPRLLKYIALFEKRCDLSNINLKDCYLVLSDLSNGKASMKMEECSEYFFYECLTKLAKSMRSEEIRSFKSYLKSLKTLKDLNANRLQGVNSRRECSIVLNPLGIPDEFLEISSSENIL
ncbi:uncharacterized protein [Leptinotarsa decemlineata]|uniref:uncharacterized protein n=1 Tax=Leptinotarsa decemlineata TaxID=7539 RepID=UPI003D306B8C